MAVVASWKEKAWQFDDDLARPSTAQLETLFGRRSSMSNIAPPPGFIPGPPPGFSGAAAPSYQVSLHETTDRRGGFSSPSCLSDTIVQEPAGISAAELAQKKKKWASVQARRFGAARKTAYVDAGKRESPVCFWPPPALPLTRGRLHTEKLPAEHVRKIIKDHGDMSNRKFR